MLSSSFRRFSAVLALTGLISGSLAPLLQAQGDPQDEPLTKAKPKDRELHIFPYELVNYTQAGHDYRIMNAEVVVLGTIEKIFDNPDPEAEVTYGRGVVLRPETFLRTDRPNQDEKGQINFRCSPLNPPYTDMRVGDRCFLLLNRGRTLNNSLIMLTNMHYYPVAESGQVQKYMKTQPTPDDPVLTTVALGEFRKELEKVLRKIDLETQTKDAQLVMVGEVVSNVQGTGAQSDYYYVQVKPDRIFKGDPGDSLVTFIQMGNVYKTTLKALNRCSFREGQRVLCFGNKDPTLSAKGSWNPDGQALWVFPHQRMSSLILAGPSAWRPGFRPIPIEQLLSDLSRWSGQS